MAPFFEAQRENLITAMKIAALRDSHAASLVAAGAVVVCALVVAILLPWGGQQGDSVLLGWRRTPQTLDDRPE
ncbi:hypothetical protein [Nocardia australiensis]|uniref:hypothetical protein n=1 Tax=Nocardia australiensis TaxID=2887191 RepID=UPI0035574C4A